LFTTFHLLVAAVAFVNSFFIFFLRLALLCSAGVEGVGQTTWSQVKAAGPVAQATVTPAYQQMECCSLGATAKWVNFFSDCRAEDVMKSNFTAQALARSMPVN
jgi:hypothetical protein